MTPKLAALKRYRVDGIHGTWEEYPDGAFLLASDVEARLASPELREQIASIVAEAGPIGETDYKDYSTLAKNEMRRLADRILALIGGTP